MHLRVHIVVRRLSKNISSSFLIHGKEKGGGQTLLYRLQGPANKHLLKEDSDRETQHLLHSASFFPAGNTF
jgi:hypothetical protein